MNTEDQLESRAIVQKYLADILPKAGYKIIEDPSYRTRSGMVRLRHSSQWHWSYDGFTHTGHPFGIYSGRTGIYINYGLYDETNFLTNEIPLADPEFESKFLQLFDEIETTAAQERIRWGISNEQKESKSG